MALAVALAVSPCTASQREMGGLLAVSAGDRVVLAEPTGGWAHSFATGPVGWLYPAPGGTLFAPDLVGGRTTVFDLGQRRPVETLDGVTMPVFGRFPDRYVVVAGAVMLFSYPGRALLSEVDAGIEHAWQVLLVGNDTNVLVLERRPDGRGEEHLVHVDLVSGRTSPPAPLPGDIRRMALGEPGLLALADGGGTIPLLDPATFSPVAVWRVGGRPRSVAFADDDRLLVVAVQGTAGGESALVWARLKTGRKGLRLGDEERLPMPGVPVGMAVSPDGRAVAVALEAGTSGQVHVVDLDRGETVGLVKVEHPPRSVVWCDPARPGPVLPEWSEGVGQAP